MESLLTSHSTYLYNHINFRPRQCVEKLDNHVAANTIPRTSREILYTFGRRSTVERSLRSYGLYGSTAVLQYGSTVVRSMEEESKGSKVVKKYTVPPPARRQEGRRIYTYICFVFIVLLEK